MGSRDTAKTGYFAALGYPHLRALRHKRHALGGQSAMFTVIGIMVIGVIVVAGLIWHEGKARKDRPPRSD